MPPLTQIAETTPNRNYPVVVPTNNLKFDAQRIRLALLAIDGDVANILAALASAAGLDSPAFTGEPSAPTAVPGTNTNILATTAFVMAALSSIDFSDRAPIDSPEFTGQPKAPTVDLSDNSTKIANTAFVKSIVAQLVGSAPGTLDTLQELALALQNNPSVITGLLSTVASKADQAAVDAKLNILQPFVDIASAATTSIGGAASENVRVTGTTTITSFGTAPAGTVRRLRFASGLTLTHNAASLILPGSANIATVSNDSLVAVSLGGSNWIVVDYQFAGKTQFRSWLGLGSLATMDLSDLMYTGASSSQTNLPPSSVILVRRDGASFIQRNQSGNVYLDPSDDGQYIRRSTGGAQMAGTWVNRGNLGQSDGFLIMQRIP